jgi:hypothetical protein
MHDGALSLTEVVIYMPTRTALYNVVTQLLNSKHLLFMYALVLYCVLSRMRTAAYPDVH